MSHLTPHDSQAARPSAKIYAFPDRRQREAAAAARSKPEDAPLTILPSGPGWYHDVAIAEDDRVKPFAGPAA